MKINPVSSGHYLKIEYNYNYLDILEHLIELRKVWSSIGKNKEDSKLERDPLVIAKHIFLEKESHTKKQK